MVEIRKLVTALGLGLAVASSMLLGAGTAQADSGTEPSTAQPEKDNPAGNFGGWLLSFSGDTIDSAFMCGEYYPTNRWSLVGCGEGAGFLYDQRPGQRDMAHFRAQYALPMFDRAFPNAELSPGFGLVELQSGRDEPGLRFAPGRGPKVTEASGAEAALELELTPKPPFRGMHMLRIKGNVGAAWIPDAPAVIRSANELSWFSYLMVNGTF